jgi:pimeloyl-ACP methyl ester carboxylesterase
MRYPLRDIIIVLPGITGSVLQRNGKDLWAPSMQALWNAASSLGSELGALRLPQDDGTLDYVDDVRATAVVKVPHLIPGLIKSDGYASIADLVTGHFEVIRGDVDRSNPANYYEFPYDWRRDNRIAARRLQRVVERQLPIWREHSGATDARVILLAHSMGGLIARYFVEVLGGWKHCRALVTFGTPFAGSLNSLNYLANGYRMMFVDLTEAMRSMTSTYQLLPTYNVVVPEIGPASRVKELNGVEGVDVARAASALEFHCEIARAVDANRKEAAYATGFRTVPFIGVRQPTFQSVRLRNGRIEADYAVPPSLDASLTGGDGTVPRASAVPAELWQEFNASYVVARHSSIQCVDTVLDDLRERVRQMQVPGIASLRGPTLKAPTRAAIALDLGDLYVADEEISVRCDLLDAAGADFGGLVAEIELVDSEAKTVTARRTVPLSQVSDGSWSGEVPNLTPGTYRLTARSRQVAPLAPSPVQDVFAVASRAAVAGT